MIDSEEYGRIGSLHVRAVMAAIDQTAWVHWIGSGHAVTLTSDGWVCPECQDSYVVRSVWA